MHQLLEVPGTWTTMIFILIIFSAKYYFGYQLSVDPELINQIHFEFLLLGVSGVLTGLFTGHFICYVYRLHMSPSVDWVVY